MPQESSQELKSDGINQLVPSSSVGTQPNQTQSPTLDHLVPDKPPPQKRDRGFPSNEPVIPRLGETGGKRPTDSYTQSIPFGADMGVVISLDNHSEHKIISDVVCDLEPGRLRYFDQPVMANSRSVSLKVPERRTAAQFTESVEENPQSSITTGIQEEKDQMQITPRLHRRPRGGIKATAMEVAQALGERESISNVTESSRRSLATQERPKSSHERYSSGGQVLPSVLDLVARRSRSSLLDTDSKTMSVEVMSITGTTASALLQDQAIFHDTEILAIIHRSKSSSTGLVSTDIWGWEGKRATLGEREQRKLQELGNRYGTSTVRPASNNLHS